MPPGTDNPFANDQTKEKEMETNTKKIACRLTTPELQKRKATVISELKALVLHREELETGFEYNFEGNDEILDRINVFIKTERMCCDFLTFQLTVDERTAILNITGPTGTKEFLKDQIGL